MLFDVDDVLGVSKDCVNTWQHSMHHPVRGSVVLVVVIVVQVKLVLIMNVIVDKTNKINKCHHHNNKQQQIHMEEVFPRLAKAQLVVVFLVLTITVVTTAIIQQM